MLKILMTDDLQSGDGHTDLSYNDHDAWGRFMDGNGVTLLLGDAVAGPFVFLSWMPPTDEMLPLAFAHAHDSDNWRISVQGTTNMGRDAYTQGQFRFQDGGVPYAADNLTWGPEGGFGLVMFGDRRGQPIRPVKKSIAEKMGDSQERAAERMGFEVVSPCPGAPAIATTFGPTERGQLVEGFQSAPGWDEILPGTRLASGLLGEPTVGPVLLLISADAGAVAVPEVSFGTEILMVITRGSVTIGGDTLGVGDVRIQHAGASGRTISAGPEGADLTYVICDRRAVATAESGDEDWLGSVREHASRLAEELVSA